MRDYLHKNCWYLGLTKSLLRMTILSVNREKNITRGQPSIVWHAFAIYWPFRTPPPPPQLPTLPYPPPSLKINPRPLSGIKIWNKKNFFLLFLAWAGGRGVKSLMLRGHLHISSLIGSIGWIGSLILVLLLAIDMNWQQKICSDCLGEGGSNKGLDIKNSSWKYLSLFLMTKGRGLWFKFELHMINRFLV